MGRECMTCGGKMKMMDSNQECPKCIPASEKELLEKIVTSMQKETLSGDSEARILAHTLAEKRIARRSET